MAIYSEFRFGKINKILELNLELYFNMDGKPKSRGLDFDIRKFELDHYHSRPFLKSLGDLFDAESIFAELHTRNDLRRFFLELAHRGDPLITGFERQSNYWEDKGNSRMNYILRHLPAIYENWFGHSAEDDPVFLSPAEFRQDLLPALDVIAAEIEVSHRPRKPAEESLFTLSKYFGIVELELDRPRSDSTEDTLEIEPDQPRDGSPYDVLEIEPGFEEKTSVFLAFIAQAKQFAQQNDDAFLMIWWM